MQEVQQRVAALEISGSAGGGLVSVTLSGKGDMRALKIDPSLLKPDEAEIVEDLIVAAHNDARSKVEAEVSKLAQEATGGLQLPPGMKLPF
jgi:DNA-binding YbaB/EbfC family protein